MGHAPGDASIHAPLIGADAPKTASALRLDETKPPHPHKLLNGKRDGASFIGPKPNDESSTKPTIAFSNFPLWLREGPWKLGALIYIPLLLAAIIAFSPAALRVAPRYEASAADLPAAHVQLAAGTLTWTVFILVYMVITTGAWPMISFTMLSWTTLLVRFACMLCAPWCRTLWLVGEALRGPALLNAIFLAMVWWLALVPLICYFSPSAKARSGFIKFNFTFFLLNVHAVNVPLGVLSHRLANRQLSLFDLWTTLVFSAAYMLFYLGVLDARGVHLYIILSPRSHFAPVVYTALLGTHVGLYASLGGALAWPAG